MVALRYMIIGAHPDDADEDCGGTAAMLAKQGHVVRFVSCTNGDAGHHAMEREALAERRLGESHEVVRAGGIDSYQILDNHDGELMPSLECRREMIRVIREFSPDVIITHRPCDYHADHRATAQLVQDASFLLSVPLICPQTPIMDKYPVILFSWDDFRQPHPFKADIAVSIDSSADIKLAMLNCHASQFFEWLPFNQGCLDKVPSSPEGRIEWLRAGWLCRSKRQAEQFRILLVARYGDAGRDVVYAETFEVSEYGRQPERGELEKLLPL